MNDKKEARYVLATHFVAAAAFAAKTFREYEALHRRKGALAKAEANAEHAKRFETLLKEGEWR